MTLTHRTDRLERLVADVAGTLQDSRTHGRSRTALKRQYAGRPAAFIKEMLRCTLTEQQEAVLAAVEAHALVVVPGAVGVGKDFLCTALALYWCYIESALVVFQAPTDRQAVEILMGEVRRHFHRAGELAGTLYARALRIPGDPHAAILSMTSTESSKLTGFHSENVRVVLSEAQGLEDHSWESAFSIAIGPSDRIVAVGNPLVPSGKFYDAATAPDSAWVCVRLSALDHPNVVFDEVRVPGAITRAGVERWRREVGEASPLWRARVLAEFPLEHSNALFPPSLTAPAVGRPMVHPAGALTIASIDPARSKSGSEIGVCVVRNGEMLHLSGFHSANTVEAATRVFALLAPFRPKLIRIDRGGPGAGIIDQLRTRSSGDWRAQLVEEDFGGTPHDRARFLNRRAEMHWLTRERLERGEVSLLRDALLLEEMHAIQFSYDARGRVVVEAKGDIAARLGRSPDRSDAAIMALASLPAEPWRVSRCAY